MIWLEYLPGWLFPDHVVQTVLIIFHNHTDTAILSIKDIIQFSDIAMIELLEHPNFSEHIKWYAIFVVVCIQFCLFYCYLLVAALVFFLHVDELVVIREENFIVAKNLNGRFLLRCHIFITLPFICWAICLKCIE